MAGRMTVVAVRLTGNVLGARTAAAPGDAASVASVAGAAMPVTVGSVSFPVPSAELAVAELDLDPRVFGEPYGARVLFAGSSDQSASLAFVNGGKHGEVTLQADTLTVTVDAAEAQDRPVWVLAQAASGGPPSIVAGIIPATGIESDPVAHGLTSGIYDVLVMVTGLAVHEQSGIALP